MASRSCKATQSNALFRSTQFNDKKLLLLSASSSKLCSSLKRKCELDVAAENNTRVYKHAKKYPIHCSDTVTHCKCYSNYILVLPTSLCKNLLEIVSTLTWDVINVSWTFWISFPVTLKFSFLKWRLAGPKLYRRIRQLLTTQIWRCYHLNIQCCCNRLLWLFSQVAKAV